MKTAFSVLSPAFKSVFRSSVPLLCQTHNRDNITRKVRSLHVNECDMKQIICHFLNKNGETILPDFSSYRIVGIQSPMIFLVGFQKMRLT